MKRLLSIILFFTLIFSCAPSEPPSSLCPKVISGAYELDEVIFSSPEGFETQPMINLEQRDQIEENVYLVDWVKGSHYTSYFRYRPDKRYGLFGAFTLLFSPIWAMTITCDVDEYGEITDECELEGTFLDIFTNEYAVVLYKKVGK